jgi:hypothetical protein
MRNGKLLEYFIAAVLLAVAPTMAFAQRGGGFRAGVAQPMMAAPQGHPGQMGHQGMRHPVPFHQVRVFNGTWVARPSLGQFIPALIPSPLGAVVPRLRFSPFGFVPAFIPSIPTGILDPVPTVIIPDTVILPGQTAVFPPVAVSPSPRVVFPVQPTVAFVPGVHHIPIGTPRADVVRQFGAPTVTAVTSTGETLSFASGMTVVLQNGQVIGAN